MHVYFYGPDTTTQRLRQAYAMIRRILREADIALSSNTIHPETSLDPASAQEIEAKGGTLLDAMDAIVIEGSTPDSEVGYLLAYAVAQKKPTIFLSERGSPGRQILKYLNQKQVPKTCQIRYYTDDSLQWLLGDFLKTVGKREVKEIPRIKFTLRITPTIDHYLDWKTQNTKLKKADYLRGEIEEIMKQDKEFQSWLQRKRRQEI
ncbi:MAG: hypothetical protein H6760_02870 [Candidatus Nomurabacteria bacterium]|nr:MAG: hypothetical protein H6760_02870 [Candidatus Nomurabacteria bacterium]